MKEYALYKGEKILEIGTIAYIARKTGIQRQTISYYKTQAYRNKLEKRKNLGKNARILIPLDDEGVIKLWTT